MTLDKAWLASKGISEYEFLDKFSRNSTVGTSFEPLCEGGVYQTPQVSGATPLRIAAGGNAADFQVLLSLGEPV